MGKASSMTFADAGGAGRKVVQLSGWLRQAKSTLLKSGKQCQETGVRTGQGPSCPAVCLCKSERDVLDRPVASPRPAIPETDWLRRQSRRGEIASDFTSPYRRSNSSASRRKPWASASRLFH